MSLLNTLLRIERGILDLQRRTGKLERLELQLSVKYNDINFDGPSLGRGASAPDLGAVYSSGSILGLLFDGGSITEQVYGGSEVLHGYDEGTDISFHVHWMPTTADAGNVKWQLEYVWTNAGATAGSPTTISVTQAAGGTAWAHRMIAFTDISGSGKTIASQFHFRFFRNPSDSSDTYAYDAYLLSIGIHYKVDSIGSYSISSK